MQSSPKKSSQTLCQMPVEGVYQHSNGLPVQLCFPRGILSLKESRARTTSSFSPSFKYSVTSAEKGV